MWFDSECQVAQHLGSEAVAQPYVFETDQGCLRNSRTPDGTHGLFVRRATSFRNMLNQREINELLPKKGILNRAWFTKGYGFSKQQQTLIVSNRAPNAC